MAPKDKAESVELTAGADKKKSDGNKGKKKKTEEELAETMSDEDKELKDRLDTCVNTVSNKDKEEAVTAQIRLNALDVIVTELRTATASMTSVPKPLKFLRPHFASLTEVYTGVEKKGDNIDLKMLELRARLADVLAVLAMTMGKPGECQMCCCCCCCIVHTFFRSVMAHVAFVLEEARESLKFKLKGKKDYDSLESRGATSKHAEDNLGSWGHEFVRSLTGEIGQEYNQRVIDGADPELDEPFMDLLQMVDVIVPFHVTHNAEAEAVDLLIEVQRLKNLLRLDSIDSNNFERICLYLIKTADFMSDPDDFTVCLACGVAKV
jgi:26S proteasome regulatory subunit N1